MWRVLCLVVASVDVSHATRSYWLLTYRQKYGTRSENHAWMQIHANLEIKVEFGHKERYKNYHQLNTQRPTPKDSYINTFIQNIPKGVLRKRVEEKSTTESYKKYDCTYDLRCLLGMYSMTKSEEEVSTETAEIRQGFTGLENDEQVQEELPPINKEAPAANESMEVDEDPLFSDEAASTAVEEALTTEEEALSAEEKTTPAEEESPLAEEGARPAEEESQPAEEEASPAKGEAPPTEEKSSPAEEIAISNFPDVCHCSLRQLIQSMIMVISSIKEKLQNVNNTESFMNDCAQNDLSCLLGIHDKANSVEEGSIKESKFRQGAEPPQAPQAAPGNAPKLSKLCAKNFKCDYTNFNHK